MSNYFKFSKLLWLLIFILLNQTACYMSVSIESTHKNSQSPQLSNVTIILTGTPDTLSNAKLLNISVGGTNVSAYQYKVGSDASTDCHSSVGYSLENSTALPITDTLLNIPDGLMTICVIGKAADSGLFQDISAATKYTWTKDTQAPIPSMTSSVTTNEITGKISVSLNFSEAITGMDFSQLSVTNGTLSNFSGTGSQFTFDVTPVTEGSVNVSLSSGIIKDLAGNALDTSPPFSKYYDINPISFTVKKYNSIFMESVLSSSGFVTLSATKPYPITINLDVVGNAVEGVDYNFPNKSVTIPANSLSANFNFNILNNAIVQPERQFDIYAISSSSNKVFPTSEMIAHNFIQDDDGPPPIAVADVAVGYFFSCARLQSGTIKCWGDNTNGQLGIGNTTPTYLPTAVDIATNYIYLTAGAGTGCGITNANVLKCWGDNGWGLVGDGTYTQRNSPVIIDSGVSYLRVSLGGSSVGYYTGCGITTNNDLKCWGSNGLGQYGNGTYTDSLTPVWVRTSSKYKEVAVGSSYVCAITLANTLECSGANNSGVLGTGDLNSYNVPVTIDPGVNYTMITAAEDHTCGITSLGVLKCWGRNSTGALGTGDYNNRLSPTVVDAGTSYLWVASGEEATCAITTANILKCWGTNNFGELGAIDISVGTFQQLTPKVIDAGVSYSKVVMQKGWSGGFSADHTCGITTNGHLNCWGDNEAFEVGQKILSTLPTVVSSGSFTNIQSDISTFCANNSNGSMFCWGQNTSYTLRNTFNAFRPRPFLTNPDVNYVSSSVGGATACGITANGDLFCWGNNSKYQLADTTLVAKATPVQIQPGTRFSMVSANSTMCAITSTGVLYCWGTNQYGQVGNGTLTTVMSPTIIDSGTTYQWVSSSGFDTCAVTTAGALKCWGLNANGQLGDGTTVNKSLPTVINAGTIYTMVDTSGTSTCALTTAGALKCWGLNNYGQLGIGNTTPQYLPVAVAGTYLKLSVNNYVTCAITTSNDLYCWGYNTNGNLGDGTLTTRTTPKLIDSGTKYTDVYPSTSVSCGITSAGVLKCWGMISGWLGNVTALPNFVMGLQQ